MSRVEVEADGSDYSVALRGHGENDSLPGLPRGRMGSDPVLRHPVLVRMGNVQGGRSYLVRSGEALYDIGIVESERTELQLGSLEYWNRHWSLTYRKSIERRLTPLRFSGVTNVPAASMARERSNRGGTLDARSETGVGLATYGVRESADGADSADG